MAALAGAAGVIVDGCLRWGAADAWSEVGGVAHAGGGEFCEDGVEGGAGVRGQISRDRRHAVDVLFADGDTAPPSPVVIGEIAVGVEAVGEFVGELAQLVGATLTAQPGQLRLGLLASLDVDEVRQPVPKTADHHDVAGSDAAGSLALG